MNILFDYECNEDDFCLMKAQHIILRNRNLEMWGNLDLIPKDRRVMREGENTSTPHHSTSMGQII